MPSLSLDGSEGEYINRALAHYILLYHNSLLLHLESGLSSKEDNMNLLAESIEQEVRDRVDMVAIEVDNQKKLKEGNDEFYDILNKLFELAPEHFNMLLDLETAVGNIRFHSVDLSYRHGMSDGIKIAKTIHNSLEARGSA